MTGATQGSNAIVAGSTGAANATITSSTIATAEDPVAGATQASNDIVAGSTGAANATITSSTIAIAENPKAEATQASNDIVAGSTVAADAFVTGYTIASAEDPVAGATQASNAVIAADAIIASSTIATAEDPVAGGTHASNDIIAGSTGAANATITSSTIASAEDPLTGTAQASNDIVAGSTVAVDATITDSMIVRSHSILDDTVTVNNPTEDCVANRALISISSAPQRPFIEQSVSSAPRWRLETNTSDNRSSSQLGIIHHLRTNPQATFAGGDMSDISQAHSATSTVTNEETEIVEESTLFARARQALMLDGGIGGVDKSTGDPFKNRKPKVKSFHNRKTPKSSQDSQQRREGSRASNDLPNKRNVRDNSRGSYIEEVADDVAADVDCDDDTISIGSMESASNWSLQSAEETIR